MSQGIEVAAPGFAAAKKDGSLTANMNRAPVLVVGGESIGQSTAIERLVARRLGMYGDSDLEGAKIDMIVEHIADIKKTYSDAKKAKKAMGDEGKEEKCPVDAWFEEAAPAWFGKLELCLGATSGFAVGGKTSWADAKLYVRGAGRARRGGRGERGRH